MTTNTAALGAADPRSTVGWRRRTRRAIPLALALLTAGCVIGGFSLGFYLPNLHNGLIAATFTALGLFILSRRPGNRAGWLFAATGVAHGMMFAGRQYGLAATAAGTTEPTTAVTWATWFGVWPLALILVLSGVTLMSFPDGHLPSRRWRPVVIAMAAAGTALAAMSALWPVEYAENALAVAPPFRVAAYDSADRVWNLIGPPCYALFQVAWVTAVIRRLRRAQGDEARQLRWFAYAVAVGAVAMAVGVAVFHTVIVGVLAVPFVALAAGVAIAKYRLYDIDPLISKTLVVGTMAALVTGGYIGVVVLIGRFIGMSAAASGVVDRGYCSRCRCFRTGPALGTSPGGPSRLRSPALAVRDTGAVVDPAQRRWSG